MIDNVVWYDYREDDRSSPKEKEMEPSELTPVLFVKTRGRWDRVGHVSTIEVQGAHYNTMTDADGLSAHFDVSNLITGALMRDGLIAIQLGRVREKAWRTLRSNDTPDGARNLKLTAGNMTYVGRAKSFGYPFGPQTYSLQLNFKSVRFLSDGERVWRETHTADLVDLTQSVPVVYGTLPPNALPVGRRSTLVFGGTWQPAHTNPAPIVMTEEFRNELLGFTADGASNPADGDHE